MSSESRVNYWLGYILQAGILLSLLFVLTGGIIFLLQHGTENFYDNFFFMTNFEIDLPGFFFSGRCFTPIGLIQLGLLILVFAQILRVIILCCYYSLIQDYWYILFSFFILSVILYSLFWH